MRAKTAFVVLAACVSICSVAGMFLTARAAQAPSAPRVIRITASKFSFSPATITLKKGEPVKLQLASTDVLHGFLIKPLKIENEVPPGKTLELTITPQTNGTFRAICDHYCGPGHSDMHMTVIVTE